MMWTHHKAARYELAKLTSSTEYALKIRNNEGCTHWLPVSPEQLRQIEAIMTTAPNVSPCMTYRFWDKFQCEGLSLLFDTSAHINDGVPQVSLSEIEEHEDNCEICSA